MLMPEESLINLFISQVTTKLCKKNDTVCAASNQCSVVMRLLQNRDVRERDSGFKWLSNQLALIECISIAQSLLWQTLAHPAQSSQHTWTFKHLDGHLGHEGLCPLTQVHTWHTRARSRQSTCSLGRLSTGCCSQPCAGLPELSVPWGHVQSLGNPQGQQYPPPVPAEAQGSVMLCTGADVQGTKLLVWWLRL